MLPGVAASILTSSGAGGAAAAAGLAAVGPAVPGANIPIRMIVSQQEGPIAGAGGAAQAQGGPQAQQPAGRGWRSASPGRTTSSTNRGRLSIGLDGRTCAVCTGLLRASVEHEQTKLYNNFLDIAQADWAAALVMVPLFFAFAVQTMRMAVGDARQRCALFPGSKLFASVD